MKTHDFDPISGAGWDAGGTIRGRSDYGEDYAWETANYSYCECGNVKHIRAIRCRECDDKRKQAEFWDDPDPIRERPKKDWDSLEYIRMIRKQLKEKK